ncbi:MAG: aminotransferase class V-fold PLP-dependent enzyme [Acidobacteria bacterium]|nr:aminotransferase class V-fold PLP-dependent enzyme [Acidobacteriota bacterium]
MNTTRRGLLQGLLGLWPFSKLPAATKRSRGIYEELGVRPVVNCKGAYTMIGASKQWPELHAAMAEASQNFVFLEELQEKIGERLSKLIGSESAMITTGAAGAITLGTCAALTGVDEERVRHLPDLTGMKSEVLIQKKHRNNFDHAVRNTGVKLVEVETKDELQAAVNERTAMLYYLGGSGRWDDETTISLEDCLAIGKKAGFPVMVDAANLLPPWENVQKLAAMGVELICISGGKHMRGPQCSGILAGRRDLIKAALLNSSPNEDALGRPMKVGREEMIGVWLAAEKYAKLDFAAIDRQNVEQAEYAVRELKKIRGLEISLAPYEKSRRVQRVVVEWDEQKLGITGDECERQLLAGEPRIAILRNKPQGVVFVFFLGDPGDEKLVARRMKEIFRVG